MSPADDAEFQSKLQRARADTADHSEDLRRIQVETEALVAAHRIDEAADAYRTALNNFPQWPIGHFNLALLEGEEERYSEAVTEMRRYLYLAPNAADARSAQDQIYKWHALSIAKAPVPQAH